MPLTANRVKQLLEDDPNITRVDLADGAQGRSIDARLTDGRAVHIDLHDNPAWKNQDELAGRIEVSYENRPQAEWQYDDNDMADRKPAVIDPADADAEGKLTQAVHAWEREGGLNAGHTVEETSHMAAPLPPEEYAFRWHNPDGPGWHIEYFDTAADRDLALKRKAGTGYLAHEVVEDPAVLYEEHRNASCIHARHVLDQYDSPSDDAVRLLHDIVREVSEHKPGDDITTYLAYPSADAIQLAGHGLTGDDIAEKREHGGWDPQTDPFMRVNTQGDWTGVTQQQADQLVWDNREQILDHASSDDALSTWTLRRLDNLDEPHQEQSLERDQPTPERQSPARDEPEQQQPRHHGLSL